MKPVASAFKMCVSHECGLLLERFDALKEEYTLLYDQHEGWRQSVLPPMQRFQILERMAWDLRQFQRQIQQFQNDLSVYRKSRVIEMGGRYDHEPIDRTGQRSWRTIKLDY